MQLSGIQRIIIKKCVFCERGFINGIGLAVSVIIALSGIQVSLMSIGDFPEKEPVKKTMLSNEKKGLETKPDMFLNNRKIKSFEIR